MRIARTSLLVTLTLSVAVTSALGGIGLPKTDMELLRDMTRDVIEASRVKPGSNGGGRWPITNSCGFTLITPRQEITI